MIADSGEKAKANKGVTIQVCPNGTNGTGD